MARSREDVRQNKAMQQILRGETPDKRIFVAMEDINEQKERKKLSDKERKEAEKRTEALKAARMPWFCPKCDKVMKKNIDDEQSQSSLQHQINNGKEFCDKRGYKYIIYSETSSGKTEMRKRKEGNSRSSA